MVGMPIQMLLDVVKPWYTEEHHYTLMGDLEERLKFVSLCKLYLELDLFIMDEPTNDLDFETIVWLEKLLANYENTVIVVSHDRHFF
jgi:ATPase subunit of ABC transporter with duplicated ATPase domains